ncbi:PAS domain S-box protein [Luteolibacter arcticus]|uniref:histidine kinase n=1 Tax=Luteolibacter arcticus TaxID=1581411 RepID=A0ABT3GMJ8_9BACT|nr:PAS domain S-box protein [Luteolibacter arcticus]MCW1924733.1 PAS domain S-box protein [Luteolibacter arcticus]
MNPVSILWPMIAGACVVLAVVQLLLRLHDRNAQANLWLALLALAVAGIAVGELAIMMAGSPEVFAGATRWTHLPVFIAVIAIVRFVSCCFGTARAWFGWAVIGLRAFALALNFSVGLNLHHDAITALRPIRFLGSTVMTAEAVFSQRTLVGQLSTLLLLAFVVDASLGLWRKGDADSRRRALVIGGSLMAFVAMGLFQSVLIHSGVVAMPYLISVPFLLVIAAMSFEMSRDLFRSARNAEELREGAESMHLAAGAAGLAFWRWEIPQDRIWVNPQGRALYGVPANTPINLERYLASLHAEDRERVRRGIDAALKGNGEFRTDYRVMDEEGKVHWVEARGKVDFNGGGKPLRMRGVSIDATERRQMQERFRLSVEASPNGVVLANAAGSILLTNRRANEMLGYGPEELLGQPVESLVPERYRSAQASYREGFLRAPESRTMGVGRELHALRKDGSEFPIEIGISPVESPEGTLVLSVIVDISARREAEDEARRHRDELAHVTRVSALSELSGSLAHELNQPLAIILANAQAALRLMAQSPPDLGEVKDILSDIVDEDRRAGEVIKRLRVLLKRGETKMLPVSFNEIATEVLHLTHADLIGRGVSVSRILSQDLPLVSGDRVQLQQVLLNLVLNAADAMAASPAGSRQLHVATSVDDVVARLSVRDEGCGLPGDVEKLFEPFYTTKPQGLGMGLAICRSIVAAHGGRLRAEPHPEGGAIFYMEIPTCPPAASS